MDQSACFGVALRSASERRLCVILLKLTKHTYTHTVHGAAFLSDSVLSSNQ